MCFYWQVSSFALTRRFVFVHRFFLLMMRFAFVSAVQRSQSFRNGFCFFVRCSSCCSCISYFFCNLAESFAQKRILFFVRCFSCYWCVSYCFLWPNAIICPETDIFLFGAFHVTDAFLVVFCSQTESFVQNLFGAPLVTDVLRVVFYSQAQSFT